MFLKYWFLFFLLKALYKDIMFNLLFNLLFSLDHSLIFFIPWKHYFEEIGVTLKMSIIDSLQKLRKSNFSMDFKADNKCTHKYISTCFCLAMKLCPALWPHGLQDARLPYPSLLPGVCSNSCPMSQWCHLTISSSVVPFSSCPQSFPASRSFPVSHLFTSGGQSIGNSVSDLSFQ